MLIIIIIGYKWFIIIEKQRGSFLGIALAKWQQGATTKGGAAWGLNTPCKGETT